MPCHVTLHSDHRQGLVLFRSISFRFQIAYILTFQNVPGVAFLVRRNDTPIDTFADSLWRGAKKLGKFSHRPNGLLRVDDHLLEVSDRKVFRFSFSSRIHALYV